MKKTFAFFLNKHIKESMLKTETIENYRKKRGLTKSKLAEMFGILPSGYTMMMISKSTTLPRLDKMAQVMGVSPRRLIDG